MPPRPPLRPPPRPPPGRGPFLRGPPPRGVSPGRGGRGSPGRGTPGRASPGRGAPTPPTGAAAPPTPPPPTPPPPPAPESPQKKMFEDLMAKKLAEWDRMMGSGKDEERAQSFDMFRKLSDEEVDLANRTVSKKRLKEFIDLQIQYFDQLAGENNPKLRSEGLKKFQQVCESELALAKAVGPKEALLEESESDSALAKKRKEEDQAKKEEEEKKKKEEEEKNRKEAEEKKKKEDEEKKKQEDKEKKKKEDEAARKHSDAQALYGMHAMSGMMPRTMPGMHVPGMPLTMTPEQMRAMMMAPQAASTSRTFAKQQRFDTPTGMMTTGMHDVIGPVTEGSHFGKEHKPLTAEQFTALCNADSTLQFHQKPGHFPSRLPSRSPSTPSMADVRKEGTDKDTKTPVSDIDNKLKLLSQLESAKGVLQNHCSPGSSTSMVEEVKNRLRKINRLQMKVIDEILGSKAELTSDIVSDLRPEKYEREKFDDVRKRDGAAVDVKEKKGKKGKRSKEPKKIVVELPEYSEPNTHVVTASISRFDDHGVCTGTTDLCPGPQESRPEVIWERPRSETRAPDRMSMAGPPRDAIADYGPPPDIGPHCIHYEQHIQLITDNVPHYHEEMMPPEKDMYCQQPAFPAPTYSVLQSQCFTPPPCLPLEFDIIARGNLSFLQEVSDVGVEAEEEEPDDEEDELSLDLPLDPPPSKPRMLSQTTIIVNRPEQGVQTEIAQPPPAEPLQPTQPPQPVPPQPVQKAPVPPPPPSPQIHVQAVEVKQSSSSDKRFAKSCEESLQRIADSVDDILNSLSSLSSDYAQGAMGQRQDRYDDDSYDDYYDDSYDEYDDFSESDDPPPRRQSQRSKGRRRTSGCDDGPSLWSWLCRSVRTLRESSPSRANQNGSHTMQVANRIRELVQRVIQASNEVIMARKAIQQGELQGEIAMQNVFEAENKLWQLINLESQLANELAQYRTLDTTSDKTYFDSLIQAEDRIRRLIQVETQLANEIGAWRQLSSQMPQSTSYTRTTMYRVPETAYSTSSATPTGLLSPSSSSTGYTS
ncbi:hypothetical protein HPB52_000222 [Rhipicephalus sanguineus]|uniref:Uncharacterized protein n=1 Tax=Rhipicephalus sanguineus TaxID=34632 RepID=A0A9D4PQV6_RHISA|nr:hypothetical protein HPB52_000222 [Rhipicephalus sanguineus]